MNILNTAIKPASNRVESVVEEVVVAAAAAPLPPVEAHQTVAVALVVARGARVWVGVVGDLGLAPAFARGILPLHQAKLECCWI